MLQLDSRSAARLVFIVCLLAEVALVLLDYHVNFGRLTDSGALRRLTNIAREDGFASWFASAQTLLVGLTAWLVWLGVRSTGAPARRRTGWLLVAVLFTYMAADDGAQLHERVGTAFGESGRPGAGLFPSFTWQLLFVPILGTLLVASGAFLWSELRTRTAVVLVGGALVMFAAAVALDFLEGLERGHPWNLYTAVVTRYDLGALTQARFGQSPYDTLVHFSRSLEEFLEMLANTCIWTAIVGHMGVAMPDIRFDRG